MRAGFDSLGTQSEPLKDAHLKSASDLIPPRDSESTLSTCPIGITSEMFSQLRLAMMA